MPYDLAAYKPDGGRAISATQIGYPVLTASGRIPTFGENNKYLPSREMSLS